MVLVSLREQLQRALGDDYLIETADDAESALEIVEEVLDDGGAVPLVITDHIMPGMKGDALVARLHELVPSTRKVMLTGQATADAVGNAVNSGGLYRFLAKPWNQDDLILTIREALRSYTQQRELEAQRSTMAAAHAAALELTATLAAEDRYVRLLDRMLGLIGAQHAALLRRRGADWRLLAVTGPERERPAPSGEARARWDAIVEAREPAWQDDAADAAWLWGDADAAQTVHLPVWFDEAPAGLLTLGAGAGSLDDVEPQRFGGAATLTAASLHTAELVDALEESNARRQRVAQELVRQANTLLAGVLRGDSLWAQRLRERISTVAHTAPSERVEIRGPAGSGREAAARAIHAESERADRPFILASCAMVSTEAELLAKLELARGGTLYLHGAEHLLDDVAEGLRRAVEAPGEDVRLIVSIGAGGREPPASLRGWCADHRVVLPSLRDRAEDIPAMAELLLKVHGHRLGREALRLSAEALERLQSYAWPGNVRELSGVIERAALTSDGVVVDVGEALQETAQTLGSYTLLERLGAGGMGEVWSARHKLLARPAAVKLIRGAGGIGLSDEVIRRFRREAEATARLRSPHTVELYDFGVTEESGFYYVMERLEGLDLQNLVSRHGALPPERAVFLLAQALESLIEAHQSGLVHRDIKPANIFACRLGASYDFVKLLDFGLVTALDDAEDKMVTQRGTVAGTPQFMAPEHGTGDDLDGRADLYSLGGVAFWLLTGERLFTMTNPAALIMAHITRTPDRPSRRLGRALPDGLDEWVLSLLEKDRDDRPADARVAHRRLMDIALPSPWTQEMAERWWAAAPDAPAPPVDPATAPTRTDKPARTE